jgi:hypothetical protein
MNLAPDTAGKNYQAPGAALNVSVQPRPFVRLPVTSRQNGLLRAHVRLGTGVGSSFRRASAPRSGGVGIAMAALSATLLAIGSPLAV